MSRSSVWVLVWEQTLRFVFRCELWRNPGGLAPEIWPDVGGAPGSWGLEIMPVNRMSLKMNSKLRGPFTAEHKVLVVVHR